jgi:hypothetical protein
MQKLMNSVTPRQAFVAFYVGIVAGVFISLIGHL